MKKFAKKILNTRVHILTAAAFATLVGVTVLYMRDKSMNIGEDLILTAADVERLNLGRMAIVFESHGSELAIVPVAMLGKQAM